MSRSFLWGKIIERDLGCAHNALLTLSFHMLFHSPPVDQQILDWIAFRLNSENSRVVTISPDAPWNACIVYDVMIQPSFFKCGISQYDIAYDAECLVVIGWCFSMWVFEDKWPWQHVRTYSACLFSRPNPKPCNQGIRYICIWYIKYDWWSKWSQSQWQNICSDISWFLHHWF